MATMIDSTMFRRTHAVDGVSFDDCKAWLESPLTKAVIDQLDSCCILLALQNDVDTDYAKVHLIVPCDVRQAIIDRERRERAEQ